MSQWPSSKARRVLAALTRIGWKVKRQTGSHRTLAREGWPDFVFAFREGEELRHECWLALQSTRGSILKTCSDFERVTPDRVAKAV